MSDDYAVAFNGGSYGNFVFWYLQWLQGKYDLNFRPWGKLNTSHLWNRKEHFISMDELSFTKARPALIHPRDKKECSLVDNLNLILNVYSKIILLHPDKDTLIWNMNNKYEKVYTGKVWTEYEKMETPLLGSWLDNQINTNEDFKKWNSKENYAIREWLSLWARSQHIDEVEFDTCRALNNPNILKISVSELRDDFISATEKIVNFVDITIVRSKEDILLLYNEWIEKQHHKNKDVIINNLIKDILNQTNSNMSNLTLIDQAEIQRILRDDYGIQIRCYKLNDWPKTTNDLLPLLYKDE